MLGSLALVGAYVGQLSQNCQRASNASFIDNRILCSSDINFIIGDCAHLLIPSLHFHMDVPVQRVSTSVCERGASGTVGARERRASGAWWACVIGTCAHERYESGT